MININSTLNKKAMSIIEVMVAIFIFTLGIAGIYMVISSTVGVNKYNHDFIIASNLARGDIELIKNIRDTNYSKFQKWNLMDPEKKPNSFNGETYADLPIFTGSTSNLYKIEIDFTNQNKTLFSKSDYFTEKKFKLALKNKLNSIENNKKEIYRLCLDNDNHYIYCFDNNGTEISNTKKTIFYKYIEILPLKTKLNGGTPINDAFKIRSKVYWYSKGKVNSTEIPTILTDWKRL